MSKCERNTAQTAKARHYQENTRRRIARATLELHETIGPSLTTRSAIAERAGVGRPTVYGHFPDDLSLGMACSALEMSENPLPDPGPWQEISDPEGRLRVALAELYAYFRRRERLWANILRDLEMPRSKDDPDAQETNDETMKPVLAHWERMTESLAEGWGASDGSFRLLRRAIGVALDFQTWRTMTHKQGLSDEQAIELMAGMVRCVASVVGPE